MNNPVFTVVIADDHEILLDGLVKILQTDASLIVIDTAKNGFEFIEKVQLNPPDLCLVDLDMPGLNGLDASEKLLAQNSDLKIIMLTMHQENSLIKKAKNIGIKGFVLKTGDSEELLFALKQVLKGKTYFANLPAEPASQPSTEKPLPPDKTIQLTDREREIVKLLCEGHSNQKIGDILFISPKTVENHRTNLMRKLQVHNIVELVRYSMKNGLLTE